MKLASLLLAIATVAPSAFASHGNFNFPIQAKVEQGTLEGNYDTQAGLQVFLGVPFAQPPVGELRWKAPQPPQKWSGVRHADKFGPRAMQPPFYSDMIFRSDGLSEDCLYLNIWAPAHPGEKGLPVLVYFYGGGFGAGDGSEPRYDGASMAARGIVAVTVNYRLNIFGFLAHPELSAETKYKGSGNYGLLDQQAALAWVHKNIAAFGGDPGQVTIAGESAGSMSVSLQMGSPLSKPLFARAIGESGASFGARPSPIALSEAEKIGQDFLARAGVGSIAAARKLSTRELYDLYNEGKRPRFPITIDNYFIKKPLAQVFEAREQAQVPLLVGWNSAEGSASGFLNNQPLESAAFVARVKELFPQDQEQLLKAFPHATPEEVEQSAREISSAGFIALGTYKWFDLHRKNSTQPVYRYYYSKPRPPMTDEGKRHILGQLVFPADKASLAPEPAPTGAGHSVEIEYALGNLPLSADYQWTADDYKVSKTLQGYFTQFIKTGNPNGEGLPEWPASKPDDATPPVMNIDITSAAKPAEHDTRFKLLETAFGRTAP